MSRMDIAHLVSADNDSHGYSHRGEEPPLRPAHSYSTRHGNSSQSTTHHHNHTLPPIRPPLSHDSSAFTPAPTPLINRSPDKSAAKTVHFHLMLSDYSQGRLPLRVMIKDHDTAESIISTVKSFWGLYEGQGLSFEDDQGNTLIAQYENLQHNANIFVRVRLDRPDHPVQSQNHIYMSSATPRPQLGEPFQMMPPQPISRPGSRAMKRRDTSSPTGHAERSGSTKAPQRIRNGDEDNSDSDMGSVSVSSSRRARGELASAEISSLNILEGNRRKRAKFESSELPLFAPPQQPMANSISSMSPQRRFQNGNMQSPVVNTNQSTFSYIHQPVMFSPNGYKYNGMITPQTGSSASGHFSAPSRGSGQQLREGGQPGAPRLSGGSVSDILPTPDPTIGSVISDEDVALQLMRLGDASNISRGRTSTSTLDETLSGKAEATSSGEVSEISSEGVEERSLPSLPKKHSGTHAAGPARKKQKVMTGVSHIYSSDNTSGDDYEDLRDGTFRGENDLSHSVASKARARPMKQASRTNSTSSKGRSGPAKLKSKSAPSKVPPSHSSSTAEAQNASIDSSAMPQQLAPDEEDLSSKPRCQRCRKSKKGCDRQRPCQRCKDAGIGIDGCISEDEGNGRKGRFGRHMGVSVKKEPSDPSVAGDTSMTSHADNHAAVEASNTNLETSKKRKR